MFQFLVLTLFLCMTSVITSKISNNQTKTDTSNKFSEYIHTTPKIPTEKAVSASSAVNISRGSVTDIERSITVAEGVQLPLQNLSMTFRGSAPKERNANPLVVPRKGVDPEIKVTSTERTELIYMPNSKNNDSISDKHLPSMNDFKTASDLSTASTISFVDNQKLSVTDNTSNTNSYIKNINSSTNIGNVTTATSELTSEDKKSNDSSLVTIQPHKKHKPKPTVTIGEYDDDKPIPASPTKNTPLGMPRKIDYIVPVMITIMAVPLLGVAAFVLYRRGKDCWDKRHYRRMDFLIDGMYND